jgi:hypothetical protein
MRRRYVIVTIVLGVVAFVIVSVLLARAMGVGDAQNAAVNELVRAEARGDAGGVTALISGCARQPACRARATTLASSLRARGAVSVIQFSPTTNFSLAGSVGTARVAWVAGASLPRVQCIRVRNAGSVLQGFTVELLRVSVRVTSDAFCPRRF